MRVQVVSKLEAEAGLARKELQAEHAAAVEQLKAEHTASLAEVMLSSVCADVGRLVVSGL